MKQNGFSQLELLCCLVISLPLLGVISSVLHSSTKELAVVKEKRFHSLSVLRSQIIINKIINDLDQHTLRILPVIHKNGLLKYVNGRRVRLGNSSSVVRPLQNSDAITYASIDLNAMQEVITWQNTNNSLKIFSCSRFNGALVRDKHRSVLGLGVSGFTELVVNWKKSGTSNANPNRTCFELTLIPQDSMISSNGHNSKEKLYYLVPVNELYTYYVDRQRQLRFLSHSGSRNIENQPIARKFNRLNFQFRAYNADIYCLQASLLKANETSTSISKCNHLGRAENLDFLLNRP